MNDPSNGTMYLSAQQSSHVREGMHFFCLSNSRMSKKGGGAISSLTAKLDYYIFYIFRGKTRNLKLNFILLDQYIGRFLGLTSIG